MKNQKKEDKSEIKIKKTVVMSFETWNILMGMKNDKNLDNIEILLKKFIEREQKDPEV